MPAVLGEPRRFRDLCENHITRAMFANSQDAELMKTVMEACQNKKFWRVVVALMDLVMKPLEDIRRWGLKCACCTGKRLFKTARVKCVRASRRLTEARKYIEERVKDMFQQASFLAASTFEGDFDLLDAFRQILVMAATELRTKFGFLSVVPWRFVEATSPDECKECLDQIDSKPLESHEPLTQWIAATFRGAFERIIDGHAVPQDWEEERAALENSPLDESLGEGYHRSTHHILAQATATSTAGVKAELRFGQNIDRIKRFQKNYGKRGRFVVQAEWRNYKRVLQIKTNRRQGLGVRMRPKTFFKRLYRMDARACEDWSGVIGGAPKKKAAVPLQITDKLKNEYVGAVLKDGNCYSVLETSPEAGGDGQERQTQSYFRVVQSATSQRRPKLVGTHTDDQNVLLMAELSFSPKRMRRGTRMPRQELQSIPKLMPIG